MAKLASFFLVFIVVISVGASTVNGQHRCTEKELLSYRVEGQYPTFCIRATSDSRQFSFNRDGSQQNRWILSKMKLPRLWFEVGDLQREGSIGSGYGVLR
ncbi:unnamed protein product [Lactuca virosa]|uniref:Uncharacterized protein n=1 Tax=Lactuca virosa TaxID=75947 RepID=A0AAU9P793_9ASTR|nr:unnamed protein product [Lactuca virosa]